MNEADERFAERLGEDLEQYLGPEILLDDLDLGGIDAQPSRLRATCSFDGRSEVLETVGDTRIEAYNRLIVAAAELRLGVAIRHLSPQSLVGLAAAYESGVIPRSR